MISVKHLADPQVDSKCSITVAIVFVVISALSIVEKPKSTK